MIKEIIGQGVGIVAMAFIILSYQPKTQKNIFLLQFIGSALFSINFFLLEAYVGAYLNVIGLLRGLAFYFKEKTKADKWYMILILCLLFAVGYPLTFTVFGKSFNLLNAVIEILPVIAMIVATFSFATKEAKTLRKLSLVCSPCWLIYDAVSLSVGGVICEVLSLMSIITAIIRHDIKK